MVHEHIDKISTRRDDSHKGDYGRVLVVAGARGLTGAAYLSAMGAMRSGSGLVTVAVPESLDKIMEIKLDEAMTMSLEETKEQTVSVRAKDRLVEKSQGVDVVAIGPGLGTEGEIRQLIPELMEKVEVPIVLDADGLNALDGDTGSLVSREGVTVITPHPGEMARLIGRDAAEVQADRVGTAESVAKGTGAVVCLKGHNTVVASPEGQTYVNDTGNSGMATAGTGDVLTGMAASFIGQGMSAFSAAVTAVYMHGLAGDIAADKKGPFCMLATDILDCLPEAFKKAGI